MSDEHKEEPMEVWDIELSVGKDLVVVAPTIETAIELGRLFRAKELDCPVEDVTAAKASKQYTNVHHLCIYGYNGQ